MAAARGGSAPLGSSGTEISPLGSNGRSSGATGPATPLEPYLTAKATKPVIAGNPNASHTGFSRRAVRSKPRSDIDSAMIFFAANQYASVILVSSARGCLPSNVH